MIQMKARHFSILLCAVGSLFWLLAAAALFAADEAFNPEFSSADFGNNNLTRYVILDRSLPKPAFPAYPYNQVVSRGTGAAKPVFLKPKNPYRLCYVSVIPSTVDWS